MDRVRKLHRENPFFISGNGFVVKRDLEAIISKFTISPTQKFEVLQNVFERIENEKGKAFIVMNKK